MYAISRFSLLFALLGLFVHSSAGQNAAFQEQHSYLGGGVGIFTYHGPIDLLASGTSSNFTNEIEPAASVFGSFPILEDWMSFRFMLVVANFNTSDGINQVADGSNEFLTKRLLLFEPEIVISLPALGYGRAIPYVFGGFGGTLADFHGQERNVVNFPGSGIPGPERSVFHIPFGAGIDVPVSDKYSIYGEASWRMNFNYVLENDPNYDSHSTSLIMAGVRVCLDCEPDVLPVIEIPWEFEGDDVPDDDPNPDPDPIDCSLAARAIIDFEKDSAVLTEESKKSLDDYVESLFLFDACCLKITGHAAGEQVTAKLLAEERARVVREFIVSEGVLESKISHEAVWVTGKCPSKGHPGDRSCDIRDTVLLEPCDCIKDAN